MTTYSCLLWTWPGLTSVKVYKSLRSREQGLLYSRKQEMGNWVAIFFGPYQHTIPSSNDELKSFRKSWLTLITENFDLSGLFKQWKSLEEEKGKNVFLSKYALKGRNWEILTVKLDIKPPNVNEWVASLSCKRTLPHMYLFTANCLAKVYFGLIYLGVSFALWLMWTVVD